MLQHIKIISVVTLDKKEVLGYHGKGGLFWTVEKLHAEVNPVELCTDIQIGALMSEYFIILFNPTCSMPQ